MGMFTTVRHGGHDYQIKTGFDDCEYFQVGDKIPWEPDEWRPGDHIDGVYDSCPWHGHGDGSYWGPWFVIKDCVIVAAAARSDDAEADRQSLRALHGITEPPRELWSEKAWADQAEREAKYRAEYEAYKKEHGDNPAGWFIHCKLREKSVMGMLMQAMKKVPE